MRPLDVARNMYLDYSAVQSIKFYNKGVEKLPGEAFNCKLLGTKTGVEHTGSNIVFYNTANNKQVQLRNPLIDLKNGVINAVIPQSTGQSTAVLSITNASELKAKVTNDLKTKLRTTAYVAIVMKNTRSRRDTLSPQPRKHRTPHTSNHPIRSSPGSPVNEPLLL